jgi:sodium-dependent dicarboxylate transporter 2/3/5
LRLVGDKTAFIYLGCFLMTAALTLFMAHTAVAAAVGRGEISARRYYSYLKMFF